MSVLCLLDAFVSVAGVTLSDHVKKVEFDAEVESLDTTAMGATWKAFIGGLKSGTLAITFNEDYAAANVDATIWANLGAVVAFEVRPTSAVASATNPKWTGSVLINKAVPVSGTVGDLAAVDVSWPTSGTAVRAIA